MTTSHAKHAGASRGEPRVTNRMSRYFIVLDDEIVESFESASETSAIRYAERHAETNELSAGWTLAKALVLT